MPPSLVWLSPPIFFPLTAVRSFFPLSSSLCGLGCRFGFCQVGNFLSPPFLSFVIEGVFSYPPQRWEEREADSVTSLSSLGEVSFPPRAATRAREGFLTGGLFFLPPSPVFILGIFSLFFFRAARGENILRGLEDDSPLFSFPIML